MRAATTMDSITVIIPTHNRREACLRAIESALAQSVVPLEVIVCDDRSTDGTEEAVQRIVRQEPRVRYIRRERGQSGPGPTRNVGLAAAHGTWIGFLDDDDTWLPTKLERQLAAGGSDFDLIAGNARRRSGGLYFPVAPPRLVVDRIALLRQNPVIISTALVRRELVLEVGGFATPLWLAGIEDYELWLRLADDGARMLVVGEALAEYDDSGEVRISSAPLRTQVALARLAVKRWAVSPRDSALRRAAAAYTLAAIDFGLGTLGGRLRARIGS
jgi:glycosyltransferase involved in cell wall biosynthesis